MHRALRSSRISRAASIPFSRGIFTSKSTRSGRSFRHSATAAIPSAASPATR